MAYNVQAVFQIFIRIIFYFNEPPRSEGWEYYTHMRLLRDEQSIKQRDPFPFGIGAEGRKAVNVFNQIRKGNSLKEHMLCHDQREPLFAP
jgi:hypothetical protein